MRGQSQPALHKVFFKKRFKVGTSQFYKAEYGIRIHIEKNCWIRTRKT